MYSFSVEFLKFTYEVEKAIGYMNIVQYVYEWNGVARSAVGHMRETSRAKSCHASY